MCLIRSELIQLKTSDVIHSARIAGNFQLLLTIREYLQKVTHYSRAQLTRLIAVYRKERCLVRKPALRHSFSSYYTRQDILLLVNLDRIHQTLSGGLTKKLLERAFDCQQQLKITPF